MSTMMRVSLGLKDIAGRLADDIDRIAGEKVNFSLFMWTSPQCSYISTADRAEVIQVLEGMIARWRQGMPDVAVHETISAGTDPGRDSPYEPLRLAAEAVMQGILWRAETAASAGVPVPLLPSERALLDALRSLRPPPSAPVPVNGAERTA